jgi:flagellar hook assembly protein FlgD
VNLAIYNVLGRKVKTLVDEHQSAGYKIEWWDGKDEKGEAVASGIYFYRLEQTDSLR